MTAPRSFNPPPINEQTERLFRAVNHALNDIDRALYPPVETLYERRGELVAAYKEVAERFAAEAEAAGITEWLQFTTLQRTFAIVADDQRLDYARSVFKEVERLGYPDIPSLVSKRMIWANELHDRGLVSEAQSVAKQLLDDVSVIRESHPHELAVDFDEELDRFRTRIGV